MKVGFIGLGKLGLPVSVAITQCGHTVYGYDVDEGKMEMYGQGIPATGSDEPNLRAQLMEALTDGLYLCDSVREVLLHRPKIVFVAVPTPSLPDNSFDTKYVEQAVNEVHFASVGEGYLPVIAISSTVLPTTVRERLATQTIPTKLCYNPSFIAMGTVIEDFLNPEFILIGTVDGEKNEVLAEFYRSIIHLDTPILHMTWENAEIVKTRYNTYIGMKIVIANENMELCHKIPHADCDIVSDTLSKATTRLTSGAYMRGGMGDGGECHPRDNIALSWLSRKLGVSTNLCEHMMIARELQTEWLAILLQECELPVVIMGKRFKPNTNLTTASTSILLRDILDDMGVQSWFYDPPIGLTYILDEPCAFLASIDEPWVNTYSYPEGSVVIDVWRRFTDGDVERLKESGVEYVALGRGK